MSERVKRTAYHNPPDPEPPRDRSDRVVVRWTPEHGPARQHVFEPRSDGDWTRRSEYRDKGDVWRVSGEVVVDNVGVESGAGERTIITWTPRAAAPQRHIFESRVDNTWTRKRQSLAPTEEWRLSGREHVTDLEIEYNE